MRRLVFILYVIGLASAMALPGATGSPALPHNARVQAQEPSASNGDSDDIYLPLIASSPFATITSIDLVPVSPASAITRYPHQFDVDATVRTNIAGALEVTLFEGSTPRDMECQMISQPGTWTQSFPLEVLETGASISKTYTVEARFRLGAANCQANGLYPDAKATQPYQVDWQQAPPPGTQLLTNGSFEDEEWDSYWMGTGNQQPADWNLSWIQPGDTLYDANDGNELAAAVPECVHRWDWQLPADEQLGEPGALILDGQLTYKIFADGRPFGGELRQTVTGLLPGLPVKLTVPILLVRRDNDNDPWSSESGVWMNGTGAWVNAATMGHRNWYTHTVETVVPQDGRLEIVIRVKNKWAGADFFFDALRLEPG